MSTRTLARNLRARWPARVKVGPAKGLRLDLRRASNWYARGTVERHVQQAIADHVKPGDVFYDVGANIGFFSVLAARLVGPDGRVHAFEPEPRNAAAVRRNAKLNGFATITVHEAAVADTVGTIRLIVTEHPGGATIDANSAGADAQRTIEVKSVTLDSLDAEPATFVKIDVEGTEPAVLRGMLRLAAEHKPLILVEADDPREQKLREKVAELNGILESMHYAVDELPDSYADTSWCVAHLLAKPV